MQGVKILVMDVDGTLTNGQINIGPNGELFKSFYCRDGLGILHAIDAGIVPVILTSRDSAIVENRARELGIQYILQGAGNSKKDLLERFVDEKNLSYSEIAYIGDDINDIDCMKLCHVVACPSDAVDKVKKISQYICSNKGGYGAVREFIDWLFERAFISV